MFEKYEPFYLIRDDIIGVV